jgi:hypothetical protein
MDKAIILLIEQELQKDSNAPIFGLEFAEMVRTSLLASTKQGINKRIRESLRKRIEALPAFNRRNQN